MGLDAAGPLALILPAIGAVLTFAGLLVRQLNQQAGNWRHIVTAAEARADECDDRNQALQDDLAQERRLRMLAEQTAVAAQARTDTLELQLDEVRRQLDDYRSGAPAAEPAPHASRKRRST